MFNPSQRAGARRRLAGQGAKRRARMDDGTVRAMSLGSGGSSLVDTAYDRLRTIRTRHQVRWNGCCRRTGTRSLTSPPGPASSPGRWPPPQPRAGSSPSSRTGEWRPCCVRQRRRSGSWPGVGEAVPLRDESADGLFISSAWHWMDPPLAVPEIARVLRDGGRLRADLDQPGPRGRLAARTRPARVSPSGTSTISTARRPARRNRQIDLPDGQPVQRRRDGRASPTAGP